MQELEASVQEAIATMLCVGSAEAVQWLRQCIALLKRVFGAGGKLIVAGNGGSLCDAAHFAEDLSAHFRADRPALPAIALTDAAFLTCVANDYGVVRTFSRGIEALGKPGDVFMGLSTSGNSGNVIAAIREARGRGLHTVCLLGRGGGELVGRSDLEFVVPGALPPDRIQEVHMAMLHLVVEGVERELFPELYERAK